MYNKICRQVLLALVLASFSGCDKDSDDTLMAPTMQVPNPTGIVLTDHSGNEMGTWGTPQNKYSATIGNCKVNMMVYPNPFVESAQLSISQHSAGQGSSCQNSITIFAVRLQENSNQDSPGQMFASAIMAEAGVAPSIILVKDQPLLYNNYQFALSFRSSGLPGGFYRIYVKINDEYLWIDTFWAADCATTPPSLRPFVYLDCN